MIEDAHSTCRDVRLALLEERVWSQVDRRAALQPLTRQELLAFVTEVKRMSAIRGYVHGNYSLEVSVCVSLPVVCGAMYYHWEYERLYILTGSVGGCITLLEM